MKSFSNDIPTQDKVVTPEQLAAFDAKCVGYAERVKKAFVVHCIVYFSLFVINLIVTIALFEKSIHH